MAIEGRVLSLTPPDDGADVEYRRSLREAIPSAVEYALAVVEQGGEQVPPVPALLLVDVRLAARNSVDLATVQRRYVTGQSLFLDFLLQECAHEDKIDSEVLKHMTRNLTVAFERLLDHLAEEFGRESGRVPCTNSSSLAERVERLLAGEPLDIRRLNYDFNGHHVAGVASGTDAARWLRQIAKAIDCRLLLVHPVQKPDTAWAWFGTREPVGHVELNRCLAATWEAECRLALGEQTRGMDGWRLTHRQAARALSFVKEGRRRPIRYADVAMLAATLGDDVLIPSLRELYLVPLEGERDGGAALRTTLRAYFAAQCNVSSTAAATQVSRKTVRSHLDIVESRIGRRLSEVSMEVQAALQLHQDMTS